MTNDPAATVTARPLHFVGICASPGLARGPLHVLADEHAGSPGRSSHGAEQEAAALRAALAAAMRDLDALMTRCVDSDAQLLLEFQSAMLEDDTIALEAFARIDDGERADTAWRMTLDAHIDDYRTTEDAYFAARAADVQDLRDRVLRNLWGSDPVAIPPGAVLVAGDLAPSRFLEIDWDRGGGLALRAGSVQSHVAILARARGVPMLVELAPTPTFASGDALLDAQAGVLIVAPDRAAVHAFLARRAAAQQRQSADASYLAQPAMTADGERVQVMLNVAGIGDLGGIQPDHCDGIGLVRTELVLRELAELHDEERQLARYVAIVRWADGLPVTFRTLDAGADKPLEGYSLADEPNPLLGLRGVRLSLLHPDLLTIQLRALARAAAMGDVKIMLPMVTVSDELERVRTLLHAAVAALRANGTPCSLPPLGIMVETPAAALTIDTFAADFFSIGSNDLIAYTGAVSRNSAQLAALADPLGPAIMRLVRQIIADARALQRPVSLCGEMAGDPRSLAALLAAGLRSISIAPARLAQVKSVIATCEAAAHD